MRARALSTGERNKAYPVFRDTIPYSNILIADFPLRSGFITTGAMNATPNLIATIPWIRRNLTVFIIFWNEAVYREGADVRDPATLIHELTHVWQGTNNVFYQSYMVESIWGQVKSIVNHGDSRATGDAYYYDDQNLQRWSDYNPEQQAKIVEHWYRNTLLRGNTIAPDSDRRYFYVENVIRRRTPREQGVPPAAQPQQTSLPPGAHQDVLEAQEVLFALGYLTDRKYVDGYTGRRTSDALRAFQRRNRLPVDGILGSNTRARLRQPLGTLVRAR